MKHLEEKCHSLKKKKVKKCAPAAANIKRNEIKQSCAGKIQTLKRQLFLRAELSVYLAA